MCVHIHIIYIIHTRRCSTCARAPLILLRIFSSDLPDESLPPAGRTPHNGIRRGNCTAAVATAAVVGGFSDFFGNPFKYVYAAACATDPPPIHDHPPRQATPRSPYPHPHPTLHGRPPPPFTPFHGWSAGVDNGGSRLCEGIAPCR